MFDFSSPLWASVYALLPFLGWLFKKSNCKLTVTSRDQMHFKEQESSSSPSLSTIRQTTLFCEHYQMDTIKSHLCKLYFFSSELTNLTALKFS